MGVKGRTDVTLDDLYWCDKLKILREVFDGDTLEIRGFKAYCSKMGKDIDESFCHHCILH
jgi:hypothetical protein